MDDCRNPDGNLQWKNNATTGISNVPKPKPERMLTGWKASIMQQVIWLLISILWQTICHSDSRKCMEESHEPNWIPLWDISTTLLGQCGSIWLQKHQEYERSLHQNSCISAHADFWTFPFAIDLFNFSTPFWEFQTDVQIWSLFVQLRLPDSPKSPNCWSCGDCYHVPIIAWCNKTHRQSADIEINIIVEIFFPLDEV